MTKENVSDFVNGHITLLSCEIYPILHGVFFEEGTFLGGGALRGPPGAPPQIDAPPSNRCPPLKKTPWFSMHLLLQIKKIWYQNDFLTYGATIWTFVTRVDHQQSWKHNREAYHFFKFSLNSKSRVFWKFSLW